MWFAVLVSATTPWQWSATAAKDALGVIGLILIAAALLFLLWFGFAYKVRKWKRTRDRGIAKWWNPADLAILPLDDTGVDKRMGRAVATLIRGRVSPRAVGGLQAVTGHATVSESLESLGEISKEAKAAMGIVAFLLKRLPNRHYEVSGALQVDGVRGRGITVELNNHGDQVESRTLWADEFRESEGLDGEGDAYQFLAIPAAAWLEAPTRRATGEQPRDAGRSGSLDALQRRPRLAATERSEAGEGAVRKGARARSLRLVVDVQPRSRRAQGKGLRQGR